MPTSVPLLCPGGAFWDNPVGEGSNPSLLPTVIPREIKQFLGMGSLFRRWPSGRTRGRPGSHHTGFDVLVGDLLVVVGAAAGGVHGGGRHGVEREDKLLSVTHAG